MNLAQAKAAAQAGTPVRGDYYPAGWALQWRAEDETFVDQDPASDLQPPHEFTAEDDAAVWSEA